MCCENAKDIWEVVCWRWKIEESISEYFDKLVNLANQMIRNGHTITDLMKIEKVIKTLRPRFDCCIRRIQRFGYNED